MLNNLVIENIAIIEQADLSFDEGLSILTGETGAGKSIIIDALAMLVGGRANTGMIRSGADQATLQAIFTIDHPDQGLLNLLDEYGLALDEGQLIINRELNNKGRSVIRINGKLVNLKTLAALGRYLVDIQGQYDTQQLLDDHEHLHLLDQFGGQPVQKALQAYQQVFDQFKQLTKQLRQLQNNQQSVNQELDLLQFQQQELADAKLVPDEEEDLLARRTKLQHYQKISDGLQGASRALNGDMGSGALDLLGTALQDLQNAANYDSDYDNLAKAVTDSYYAAQEASRELDEKQQALTYDEQELVEIDDRLQLIHRLKRKYGETVADILAFQEQVNQKLANYGGADFDEAQLTEERNRVRQQLTELADQLQAARQQAAEQLSQQINQQLDELLMSHARFEVRFTPIEGFLASGNQEVAFYVQTNEGEAMAPLVKVASGGEAARLMLALKAVFINQQPVETVVFDEIDTGVSGRVAQAIANKMTAIAKDAQVLAITHLPQVAAAADQHYFIEKEVAAGRTSTQVSLLDEPGREHALALMLSGDEITEAALANAKALRAGQ
ncbi:DNA repair protein RecN [Lactobacillaceae bacterium L1_55_11]|nr:DNA repair protein RecN [Lactobacillaceae bacterium L1_55_11]